VLRLFAFADLIFAPLYLDYSVGVDDWASRSTLHMGAQNGAVAFATTHWSVVLEAQSQSPAAREALEKLCRLIGDLFTVSLGGKEADQRKQKT